MNRFKKFLPALAIAMPLLAVAAFSSANGGLLALAANAGYGGQYSPTVTPSSSTLSPSTNVDFNGRGFASEENVTVMLNGSTVASAHADGGGNFSTGSLTVPSTAGSYTYTFTGATSNSPVSVTITVSATGTGGNGGTGTGGTPTAANPMVTPMTESVSSGSNVDFNGRGFTPEENVSIMLNGATISGAHSDGGGNFSTGSLTTPSTPGSYTYTFTGSSSNMPVTSTITVQ